MIDISNFLNSVLLLATILYLFVLAYYYYRYADLLSEVTDYWKLIDRYVEEKDVVMTTYPSFPPTVQPPQIVVPVQGS